MPALKKESLDVYRVFRSRNKPRSVGYPKEGDSQHEKPIDEAINNLKNCWTFLEDVPEYKRKSTRFSDGNWCVLYTAIELETSLAESVYHLERMLSPAFDKGERINLSLVYFKINYNNTIMCFKGCSDSIIKAILDHNYENTFKFANDAICSKIYAIRVPSARKTNGTCVPIFSEESLSDVMEANGFSASIEANGNRIQSSIFNHEVEIENVMRKMFT